jgi:glycine/serine hydroxymethyltransferase
LRLGVAAATTRGLGEAEMTVLGSSIAELIDAAAEKRLDAAVPRAAQEVAGLCDRYPIY